MIKIIKNDGLLILKYIPYQSTSWMKSKIANNEEIIIARIFHFVEKDIYQYESVDKFNYYKEEDDDDFDDDNSEVLFVIGKLIDDYWVIDKNILKVDYNIYISEEYSIGPKDFRSGTGLSIFREIFKVIQEDLWIGGKSPKAIEIEVFKALINRFPTETELHHYISSRASSVLKEYFTSAKDFEKRYEDYRQKRSKKYRQLIKPDTDKTLKTLFKDDELGKYKEIKRVLIEMMETPDSYSEKKWQNGIIEILLLLYPKYICVLENVKIRDLYSEKKRFLDYLFIDTNGNTDIIEIKKPFSNCLLRKSTYRDNYVPMMELSGAVMQISKYIFYMNKWGTSGEKYLTDKYKDIVPVDINICITNPKGIIIMGQSKDFTPEQIKDFEIIKRNYNNVIDIFSYDELLDRVSRIIEYFE